MPNTGRFWIAALLGVIIMVLIAFLTAGIWDLLPLAAPFIGGYAAGFISGRKFPRGGVAGMAAGVIGVIVVTFDVLFNSSFLHDLAPRLLPFDGMLFLVVALIYLPVAGFIGGALGGRKRA
jgi:hypothetical protein